MDHYWTRLMAVDGAEPQKDEATNVPLVMHEPRCSLDADHKGSCVHGERIEAHAPTEPVIWKLNATIERLTRINEIIMATSDTERAAASKAAAKAHADLDAARLELADTRVRLAERDAQVTALTKRLSEGQG